MNQRFSVTARALAATALVAGFFVLVTVVALSLGDGESSGSRGRSPAGQATRKKDGDGKAATARFYVVQNGDTLTSIAHRTEVSIAHIQRLNPGVDPQILIAGEKLKLR
jgi:LysM repeat protein